VTVDDKLNVIFNNKLIPTPFTQSPVANAVDNGITDDDEVTVCTSNVSTQGADSSTESHNSMTTLHSASKALPHTAHKAITMAIKVSRQFAISDSGATGHFVMEDAPVTNVRPTRHPVRITCPNGETMSSTHECNLDIPWLPQEMTKAHIVPGLTHSLLISIKKFCDEGCRVIFDKKECRV